MMIYARMKKHFYCRLDVSMVGDDEDDEDDDQLVVLYILQW